MTRRMSVSMTIGAVRAGVKTETRRHEDTWANLNPGDDLLLIEKGMGLPAGAKQVVICEVEVTEVDVRPLWPITWPELNREGLADRAQQEGDPWRCPRCGSWKWIAAGRWPNDHDPKRQCVPCGHYSWDTPATYEPALRWFCSFWLAGHGYRATDDPAAVNCRRIRWRYLDA